MLTVKVVVRIHHFRLKPEAKFNTEAIHVADKRLEAVGKLLWVRIPAAQSCVIVVVLAEPAVVHHKDLHSKLRGLSSQNFLARLVYIELGRFPRVIKHRPDVRINVIRKNLGPLEAMEKARSSSESSIGVPPP